MTLLNRTPFCVALVAIVGAIACSSSTSPSSDNAESEMIASGGSCSAKAPPNARCIPCANGYQIENGAPTCTCCTPEAGETCGGPPPNAKCMACPGGYQQKDGQPTCECCAPDGGAGETCGGPPPNAKCMACPGGYKQKDGEPTCECCS